MRLKHLIAQKLMLDFRYFDVESSSKNPMLELPEVLSDFISSSCLGGVILFKENLKNISQILCLNHQLQKAAENSALGLPLFISTDHEGGRVTRLPENIATNMTGNMSIGATYQQHGTHFASKAGDVLASELASLGINVNFAPVADVNLDANNPVINVRAFGDRPKQIGALSAAAINAMQQKNVITALKHFPGHGNTHVDSHTGLPCVEQDVRAIEKYDLAAFTTALSCSKPEMIMTAHVQYPALDDEQIAIKNGQSIIVPATMSRKIIHDLLRVKIGYQGLIITDALDMNAISEYFDPVQAVINSFAAGIDIALMPIRVRSVSDLQAFTNLIDQVCDAVNDGVLEEKELHTSCKRICDVKSRYLLANFAQKNIDELYLKAQSLVGCPSHKKIQDDLALQSITLIKGDENELADSLHSVKRAHIVMPHRNLADALISSLNDINATSIQYQTIDFMMRDLAEAKSAIEDSEVVIAGHMYPKQSPVELGGIEDINQFNQLLNVQNTYKTSLIDLLKHAKKCKKKVIFVSLRAPYDVAEFEAHVDFSIATYAYNLIENNKGITGPSFAAIAKILWGQTKCTGTLPVTLY